MGKPFHSAEDKRMKLQGSICLWKGKPFMVLAELPGNEVELYRLGDGTRTKVDYTSEDFDYRSVPLGYIDYGKSAYYLTRMPHRQNKAGVSMETISVLGRGMHPENVFNTKAMEQCVLGEYTSFERACDEVEQGKSFSRAFHRRMAVVGESRHIAVHYRGRLVGYKVKKGYEVQLVPSGDYSYINNILRKTGVSCF